MIKYFIFFGLLLFTPNLSAQQNPSICDDLIKLHIGDQSKRGRATDVSADNQRLKLIGEMYNEHGIPYDTCSSYAIDTYWLTHAHSKSIALRKLSFPIIYDLYVNNFIDSTTLIEYHTSSLYNSQYSDFWGIAKDSSVEYFINKLELNTSKPIDVQSMDLAINNFENIRNQKKNFHSKWRAKTKTKSYQLDGKTIEIEFKGTVLRIYTIQGKLYFDTVPPSGDVPSESMPIEEDIVNGGYIISKRDRKSRFVIQEDALIHLVAQDTMGVYYGF